MNNINKVLYLAAAFKGANEINDLVTRGANPNHLEFNDAPLHSAIDNNDHPIPVVLALLDYGANPNLQNKLTGETPLHLAIREGNMELAILLIENGADLTIENIYQQTPMQLADMVTAIKIGEFAIHR